MIFLETALKGAYTIEIEPVRDERGHFARTWSVDEFQKFGLNTNVTQCSFSFNKERGTLRGMHYQVAPCEEAKLIRCVKGSIYDVVIDLRERSDTYKKWIGINLTENNNKMLYIPEGFAHGFLTLEENTEVFYHITGEYSPNCERGIRWNDPLFNIVWPENPKVMSEKDKNWEGFGI